MEMNQAETAFIYQMPQGYSLRWFTPNSEMDLCGHATLASAHTLWETGHLAEQDKAVFSTKSGQLSCSLSGNRIEMDFPSVAPVETAMPSSLCSSLDYAPVWVGRNRMDYLIELSRETEVRALRPDLSALAEDDARGFIITARSQSSEVDFVSRFFAPRVGVPEDPVTGSAHCCLGPYWATKLGRTTLTGYQASQRGGTVGVTVRGERVTLSGTAVTVLEGRLRAEHLSE